MHIILILILVIIIFSYIGFTYQFNINKHKKELNQLKEFQSNVISTMNNSKFQQTSDSILIRSISNVINDRISTISFLAPVDGFVTQSINKLKNHNGIDIASEKGNSILASYNGIVIFSGYNRDLGNTLIISHPYNYFTVYSHCDSLFVEERQKVLKGDVIAAVGESGKTTAPHLHFEIWYNDSIIDPRNIINKYGDLDVSTE